MRTKLEKILASFLVLTLLFSSVSVAAQKDTGTIDTQQEQAVKEISVEESILPEEVPAEGDVLSGEESAVEDS